MAELVADLLAPGVWHVGLFIVATARHGHGDAQLIWQGLAAWMQRQGAQWIRLGVVENNPRGLRFWRRQGLMPLRDRQGVEIAGRLHRVHVLARPVDGGLMEDYLALVPRDAPEPAGGAGAPPAGALPAVSLRPAETVDAQALADLRVRAMQPSLERVGRFDPQRARQRLLASFDPQYTRWIVADGQQVGVLVLRPQADAWLLDHLYLRPGCQGQGIGAAVMRLVLAEVDAAGAALRVVALRGSDANRFYRRHGFGLVQEDAHDLYYLRPAAAAKPADLRRFEPAAD
ncbi:GNAT family N-acetyltransferase [Aquincola sp. J276]|nr:GNAT family N-acetyltransferase [Aquincola sp. J276]